MKKLIMILLVVGLLASAGCASTNRNMDKTSLSMIGSTADDMKRQWGPPNGFTPLDSGNRIFAYVKRVSYFDWIWGVQWTGWCKAWFEVTPDGIIIDCNFEGRCT